MIILVRAYYAPLGSCGKGWVPLAERLGIAGGYTLGCQYFMARFSAQQPYAASLEQFHEVFRADERELISLQKALDKEGAAHCTNASCVTGIEHADEFFPRIEVEMSRRSHKVAALVLVILGDGHRGFGRARQIWPKPGRKSGTSSISGMLATTSRR